MAEIRTYYRCELRGRERVRDQRPHPRKSSPSTRLANRVSLSFSRNLGALTENVAFIELLRRGIDVSYYRTASGREVDFACRRGRA